MGVKPEDERTGDACRFAQQSQRLVDRRVEVVNDQQPARSTRDPFKQRTRRILAGAQHFFSADAGDGAARLRSERLQRVPELCREGLLAGRADVQAADDLSGVGDGDHSQRGDAAAASHLVEWGD
jgi:hypothetical protein